VCPTPKRGDLSRNGFKMAAGDHFNVHGASAC
jgi:hypothetical protein